VTDGPRRRPRTTGRTPPKGRAPASAKSGAPAKAKGRAPAKAKGRAPARATGRPAPRARGRVAAGLVVSVVLVGFLLIGVFPTRTWLAQREETQERQAELDRIRAEEAVHEERLDELDDPDEIEAIAREEHGLVRPGEDAYQMLPPAVPPVELPDTWPFTGADDWLNR
jgi:cell division protein FtsB